MNEEKTYEWIYYLPLKNHIIFYNYKYTIRKCKIDRCWLVLVGLAWHRCRSACDQSRFVECFICVSSIAQTIIRLHLRIGNVYEQLRVRVCAVHAIPLFCLPTIFGVYQKTVFIRNTRTYRNNIINILLDLRPTHFYIKFIRDNNQIKISMSISIFFFAYFVFFSSLKRGFNVCKMFSMNNFFFLISGQSQQQWIKINKTKNH